MGDHTQVPRDVDHFAVFRNKNTAADAATELRARGYSVSIDRKGLKSMLIATSESTTDLETINQCLAGIVAIVTRYGGDYDGWGAPLS